ncbi:MAG TPA: BTAD domain-containing putative transcriptional regulator [Candidatus Sulfomarinibacteraceae bacterium]|nr:BTAD domain-containing putative transcriptional regulator [Candidatus Sulfomarinibacteraceae bacterium]
MFEIRLFGAVEVLQDDEAVSGFRSQKTLALLAYLIVENRPLARDYLAGLLWPETTQSDALGHLRRALYNLGSLLPGCLDVDRRTARYSPEAPASVDVHRFDQLRASTEREALVQAAALARAPFLEGTYLDDCPQFEAWLAAEQERLRMAAGKVLRRLIASPAPEGATEAPEQTLTFARRLAQMDPWREDVHRQLMLLLARTGRREEALAQYDTCRRILREELDLTPSAATSRLYERIRYAPQHRHNLPPDPTPFVGRQQDLAKISQLLADPRLRLLTVLGPGGAGKTRLAVEAARRCLGHFLEGVWYVNLTGVERARLLPGAIAGALGLSLPQNADVQSHLLGFLRDRELLLLLDNFEQLVSDDHFLPDLLQSAPHVTILVTSRRELQLRQEQLYDLPGLPYPQPEEAAEVWTAYDAMRLLDQALSRLHPRPPLDEHQAEAARICRLVQGSPLAIELAAASARTISLKEIAAAIEANLDVLQTDLRNVPPRHRSMRAAIDHSWERLTRDDQEAFRKLAVFRGGFSLHAAEAVAGVSRQQLQHLLSHSLLRRSDDLRAPRYELHELLRQYAEEKAKTDPQTWDRVRAAHTRFYLALLADEGDKLNGDQAREARALLARETDNVRAAWRNAARYGTWELLLHSLDSLVRFYRHGGRGRDSLPLLDDALKQAETHEAPAPVTARLLAARARLLALTGQSQDSLRVAKEALDWGGNDATIQVEAAYAQALANFNQGQQSNSRQVAEAALTLARQEKLSRFEPLLLNMIGRTYLRSDLEEAQRYFKAVLQQAQTAGDQRLQISAHINHSLVLGTSGDYAGAEEELQRASALAEQSGHRELRGTIALNLGSMALQQGHFAAGRTYYDTALEAYGQSGDRARMGLGYHSQAVLAVEEGDFLEARRYLHLALALYRETNAQHRDVEIQLWLANVSQAMGKYMEARKWLRDAQTLAAELESPLQQVEAHWRFAWLAIEVGDMPLAETQLHAAERLLPQNRSLEHAAWIDLARSRLCHNQDHLDEARRHAQQALALVRGRNARLLPECTIRLAHVQADLGLWQEAQALYAETEQLRRARRQPHLALEASAGLARAALALGNRAEAGKRVVKILAQLHAGERGSGLYGQREPFRLYRNCYEVLRATNDARAEALLQEARDQLQQRAAELNDAWRRSFLQSARLPRPR